MNILPLSLHNQTITAFLPDNVSPKMGIWYTFPDSLAEAETLFSLLSEPAILVAIQEPDWEQHFTPWQAPRVFKKGKDFGGGALAYHQHLCQNLIPEIEQQLGIQAAWRGILGYSLAGLLALYGATVAPFFQYVACVSGSLWFDGWTDFVQTHTPPSLPQAIYFSLGDNEHNSRNPRMATVQTAMQQCVTHWQQYDCSVQFEYNQGGHFDDVPQRLARAANGLVQAA